MSAFHRAFTGCRPNRFFRRSYSRNSFASFSGRPIKTALVAASFAWFWKYFPSENKNSYNHGLITNSIIDVNGVQENEETDIKIANLEDIGLTISDLQLKISENWENSTKPGIKIMFFDIEGVLNAAPIDDDLETVLEFTDDGDIDISEMIDNHLLFNLKYIIDHTQCKIVLPTYLSGGMFEQQLINLMESVGIDTKQTIIGRIPKLKFDGKEIPMYLEIAKYLNDISDEYNIINWLAVDDRLLQYECNDNEAFELLNNHIVNTKISEGRLDADRTLGVLQILVAYDYGKMKELTDNELAVITMQWAIKYSMLLVWGLDQRWKSST